MPLCTLETSEKSFASTSRSRENRLSRPEVPRRGAVAASATDRCRRGGAGGRRRRRRCGWIFVRLDFPPQRARLQLRMHRREQRQRSAPFAAVHAVLLERQRVIWHVCGVAPAFALAVVVVGRRQSRELLPQLERLLRALRDRPLVLGYAIPDGLRPEVPRTRRAVIQSSICLRPRDTARHRPLSTRRQLLNRGRCWRIAVLSAVSDIGRVVPDVHRAHRGHRLREPSLF